MDPEGAEEELRRRVRAAPGTQAGSVPPNLPGSLPENVGKDPGDVHREAAESA